MRESAHLRLVETKAPTGVNGTVPKRRPNKDVRAREYLTLAELDRLMKAARARGRHGHRDATMILVAYRHGMRVSELCDLQWGQVDFTTSRITVHRGKKSIESTQPLDGTEMRALRRLQREQGVGHRHVFISEHGHEISPAGFRKMLSRVGAICGLPRVHPHMLRHSCGFALSDRGLDLREIQAALGHVDVKHTVRYVALAPSRLDRMWG